MSGNELEPFLQGPDRAPQRAVLAYLTSLGCSVLLERGAWWRCLIEEPGRQWLGEATTPEGALDAAFALMVPSPRIRARLLTADPIPQPAPSPPAPPPPPPAPEPAPATAPAPPRSLPEPQLELTEALAMLTQQRDDVVAASRELGEIAPSRLRLLMLHWITRARAVQEQRPGDPLVHGAVHGIANLIQEQAFRLWPGSVPALQLTARPGECRSAVDPEGDGLELRTWAEVSAAAQAELERLEAEPGRDADGWADPAALRPRPNDPDGQLRELCAGLARISSEWERPRAVPPPGSVRADAALRAELLSLAQRARWLRGCVSDVGAWSGLIGHLRRIGQFNDRDFPDLARALDEGYSPAHTWAKELGQDPERKIRRKARRELLQRRPRGSAVSTDDLRRWLMEAFEILDNPDLAVHLREHADRLSAFAPEELGDRRIRGRFKKLLEILAGPRDAAREAMLAAELAEADLQPQEHGAGAAAEVKPAPDPRELLLAKVRARTRGKRILFVSNRADPPLEADLREGLEPVRLDWCVAEDRRVASAAQSIASGTYNFVLCATGFISHKTEKSLRDACIRGGRVPYVRVFKGRLVSCLRALERDLGLTGN